MKEWKNKGKKGKAWKEIEKKRKWKRNEKIDETKKKRAQCGYNAPETVRQN